jgi:hypothetical protein
VKTACQITIFTCCHGKLSKSAKLTDDGKLVTVPAAAMTSGSARRVPIADVRELAAVIEQLDSNEAIALGALRTDFPEQVKVVTKDNLNGTTGVIARTGAFICYQQDRPAFALLDYDAKGKPTDIAVDDYWAALVKVLPALRDIGRVVRRSTSAGLYRTDTGEQFAGSGGMHVFVAVQDGEDIERFLKTLHERCWLAGYGWIWISKAGSMLERSIVDRVVGDPERLVFEAAPILTAPLAQDAESRRPVAFEGATLDTRKDCPPVTKAERTKFNKLVAEAKARIQPQADKVQAAHIDRRAEDLATRKNISKDEAVETIKNSYRGVLLPDFELVFSDREIGMVTVGDVLKDPKRFEKKSLADPVEGVEYGHTTAMVMLRKDGTPWIKSFAHGDTSYSLEQNRPIVEVTCELSAVATRGEEALREAGIPLYQRGGTLVRPIIEEVDASHGRRTKVARFVRITETYLRDKLSAVAKWEKYSAREKKAVQISPPYDVAATILSREGEWGFRTVAGVISTPTMRPDGTILDQHGYDEATRLLLVEPPSMPSIREQPTRDDALASLAQLKDLLTEFPLVNNVSKSAALSALITPVVRGAFPVTPMHGIRAPVPGSGKSYLLDCTAAIAIGQMMPVMAAGRTEEETEKRLGAAILTGQPLISIDNISLELRGDALCQIIERPVVEIRILGKSERVRVEARGTCVYCTGNNLVIVGDLCRRVITAVLDPQLERPELREFTGSPVARILANRGAYVAAALTVCRAYIVAGRPDKAKPLASFEGWSDTVRSALMWLGEADAVDSIETARRDDPERIELDELLTAWAETLGVGKRYRFTLAEVIKIIGERTQAATELKLDWPRLHAAIHAVAARGREGADSKSLGLWMRSRNGRIVGNRRFANMARDRGTYWWIEVKDEAVSWDQSERPGQWEGADVEEREAV